MVLKDISKFKNKLIYYFIENVVNPSQNNYYDIYIFYYINTKKIRFQDITLLKYK